MDECAKGEQVEKLVNLHVLRIEERLDGMDRATELQKEVIDHRLEGLNHLRSEYTKDRGGFVTVTQHSTDVGYLKDQLGDVANRLSRIEGSAIGSKAMWGYVVGGVGLIATIVTLIILLSGS